MPECSWRPFMMLIADPGSTHHRPPIFNMQLTGTALQVRTLIIMIRVTSCSADPCEKLEGFCGGLESEKGNDRK